MDTEQDHFKQRLLNSKRLHIQQVFEGFEIILGWESRNKYHIIDENMKPIAFAAERSNGIGGALLRQILGHWRPFQIILFNQKREKLYQLNFPFRWFFKTLYVKDASDMMIGTIQQRFAIFRKKFDLYDRHKMLVAKINSPLFKIWTFEFFAHNKRIATAKKKWSGVLSEFFTDKDNFLLSFSNEKTEHDTKLLMLATCLMIDIVHFEENQGKRGVGSLFD